MESRCVIRGAAHPVFARNGLVLVVMCEETRGSIAVIDGRAEAQKANVEQGVMRLGPLFV